MRSVTAKILIWSLSTIVLSLVAFSWISTSVADRARGEAFARSDAFELYQAISAYENGGQSELARYLAALHRFEGPGRYLTDSTGRDLLTGEDRSALLEGSQRLRRSFMNIGDKFVVRVASPDWRYATSLSICTRTASPRLHLTTFFSWPWWPCCSGFSLCTSPGPCAGSRPPCGASEAGI